MASKVSITGIVLAFLFAVLPHVASAATLSVTPANGTFSVGDRVTVQVVVSSSVAVNAVSGTVTFPPIFSVESVSKGASVLNFWVREPSFSATERSVQFEGVALNGFLGTTGNIVTVTLRANREGTGSALFSSGQILANDGQGTDITSGFGSSNFTVIAKAPAPAEAPPKPKAAPTTKPVEEPKEEPADEPIEEPQQPPTLQAPEIQLAKKFGEQAVAGSSGYTHASVLLTFVSTKGVKVHIQDVTDEHGSFLTVVPSTLKYGTYEVSAVIIKNDFSYTQPSNKIIIQVGNVFSDASLEVRYVFAGLIVILLALLLTVMSYARRHKKHLAHVQQESTEALSIVQKSFKILRKDLGTKLETKRTNKAIVAHLEELQADLKDAEKIIIKKIKNISKRF